jgi:hypothetical protein
MLSVRRFWSDSAGQHKFIVAASKLFLTFRLSEMPSALFMWRHNPEQMKNIVPYSLAVSVQYLSIIKA